MHHGRRLHRERPYQILPIEVVCEILGVTQDHIRPEETDNAKHEEQDSESFGSAEELLLQSSFWE